jgi:hypothetical protein
MKQFISEGFEQDERDNKIIKQIDINKWNRLDKDFKGFMQVLTEDVYQSIRYDVR